MRIPLSDLHLTNLSTAINALLLPRLRPSRPRKVKNHHTKHHHHTIQDPKVSLRDHQVPRPSLQQLHRTINSSDDQNSHTQTRRKDDHSHFRLLEDLTARAQTAKDHPNEEREEDDDGGELKEYTCNHYSGPGCGVADRCLLECYGGHATADGLDDERDQIDGAEDVKIHLWGDGGGLTAEGDD